MKEAARKLHEFRCSDCRGQRRHRLNKERPSDVFYDGTDFTVIEEPVLENSQEQGCTLRLAFPASWCKEITSEAVKASKDFVFFKRFNIQTSME